MAEPYPISCQFEQNTRLNAAQYQAAYQASIENPDAFWEAQARAFISWDSPWQSVLEGDFYHADRIQWFATARLNACYNAVDRHLAMRPDQVALIWQGNAPDETQSFTYSQLHEHVCRLANALIARGIQAGDCVCIYLPMIPEAVFAMLACARIGAIHSVVFAGFSANALKTRLLDANCQLLITADEGVRGEKIIPLKQNCDHALEDCPAVHTVLVVKRTGNWIDWNDARDVWYHETVASMAANCQAVSMDANAPLFILYTSGSTGQPKGVVHATGGYLVYVATTHYYAFDHQEGDVFWCTADIGWITGHSYLVYGPLLHGGTTVMFEGVPNYPTHSRYWEIIDQHQVRVFYTAPTALRALRREGDDWVHRTQRTSLRLLGSVGEPINPDVWEWYYHTVGNAQCPIVNTWWQTETGGIMATPLPGATPLTPGAAGVPFFGVVLDVVDDKGRAVAMGTPGLLVIRKPWPGLMKTIHNDPNRLLQTYFNPIPGCYLTGDGALYDDKNRLWITGRNDDVINTAGHRIGSEELESAFVSHQDVSEAAVIGIPDPIKGEAIVAFITLKRGVSSTESLKQALIQHVRNALGALATPHDIQWVDALPKTRSGKIMRRILRKIACHDIDDLGDLSTLADATVIDGLIRQSHQSLFKVRNPT